MRRAEFDDMMNGLVRPDGPGAAVAVQQGGDIIHSAGYGLANVEWAIPIDTDDLNDGLCRRLVIGGYDEPPIATRTAAQTSAT